MDGVQAIPLETIKLPTQPGKYAFFHLDGSGADLYALAEDGAWLNADGYTMSPARPCYKFWFHLPSDYRLYFER